MLHLKEIQPLHSQEGAGPCTVVACDLFIQKKKASGKKLHMNETKKKTLNCLVKVPASLNKPVSPPTLTLTWRLSATYKGIWLDPRWPVAHSRTVAWIGLYGRNTALGWGDMKGAGQAVKARLIPLRAKQRCSVSPTRLPVRWRHITDRMRLPESELLLFSVVYRCGSKSGMHLHVYSRVWLNGCNASTSKAE